MSIDNNNQAVETMNNCINSLGNRLRAIYNYGYHDGYKQGQKDATDKIIEQITLDEVE